MLASHPTWVRGLKHHDRELHLLKDYVAPYVGAWIETDTSYCNGVATWVAPYVGAWIETAIAGVVGGVKSSHPTWVRGLKLLVLLCASMFCCRTLRGCVD